MIGVVVTEVRSMDAGASTVLTWTEQSPATSPPTSASDSIASDPATGNVVLFGGEASDGQALGGTWTWSGSTWTQQSPATSPPARSGGAMTYDAATGDIVLFGGIGSSGNYLADTWTWNGSNWTSLSPATSPSARSDTSIAYDSATGKVVIFGGEASNGQSLGDTWTWNGSTWTQADPSKSPGARTNSSMAYDPATGNVVLFSGFSFSPVCCSADTWTWNGSTWAEQSPSTSPPVVSAATMTYDSAASEIVLFGGFSGGSVSSYNETWTWNGSTWSNQTPATSPPGRIDASMAYDTSNGSMVLFGGSGGAGLADDTWVLSASGAATSTTSGSGVTTTTASRATTTTSAAPPSSTTSTTETTTTSTSTTTSTTMPSAGLTSTTTTVGSAPNPATAGQEVTYSATVSPVPDGGTLRFTDDGTGISTCGALAINPTKGTAACSVTYSDGGTHEIQALYSGDATFGTSRSGELAQVVQQSTPITQGSINGLGYTSLSPPVRIADTRSGAVDPATFAGETLGPGRSITIDMPPSVPSNAGAVVAQLTAVGSTSAGYLAAYAAGGSLPKTANVDFDAGQIVGNLVTIGLGVDTNGALALSVYNGPSGRTDFTLDLYGYYASETSTSGDGYVPLTPTRIFDTRAGSELAGAGSTIGPGGTATVPATGVGNVPRDAAAVVVNVAVVNTTAPSYIQGYPTGSPPASSTPTVNENWVPGELLSADAIIGVGQNGSITFANAAGRTDVVVDVEGYFLPPGAGGALFNPLPTPVRLSDTRPGGIPGGASVPAHVAGANGVPANASAGVLNIVDIASGPNYLTAFPAGQPVPTTADVNYAIGDVNPIVGNSAYASAGVGGSVDVYNGPPDAPRDNVVIDEFGYFTEG